MLKAKRILHFSLVLAVLLTGCVEQIGEPMSSPEKEPIQTAPYFEPSPSTQPFPSANPTPSVQLEPTLQQVKGSYFDNTLFVGDSIMENVRRYTVTQRQEGETLGTAQFLTCSTGIALADIIGEWERGVQFSYQGKEQPLEKIVAEIAPQRVFLLLGMNDIAGAEGPISVIIDRYIRLISNLQAVNPDMEIIIITSTPKVASQWLPEYLPNRNFGNELIGEYAAELVKMCQEMEIPCIDLYTALKDENGALPDAYCLDGYVHLNDVGSAAVVDTLNAFAEGR